MQIESKPTLLVISQVYVPDPASVGQHIADVAEAMAARGYHVRVLAAARGYENPQVQYPRREQRAGVDVRRLPWSSFGKKSLVHRIVGQACFLLQVLLYGMFARRLDGILVSTSPPMASFAAVLISYVRRVPITYWLMDLNPDQAIALGKVGARNPLVWAIRWLNRRVFARAATVIVLDRYMAERVERQYRVAGRLEILPPWPHDESLADVPRDENPFVAEQQLAGRFVVMYSGNHSLASPLSTLVEAALALREDSRFVFMFIGGGLGKRRGRRGHCGASVGQHSVAAVPAAGTDQVQSVGRGPARCDAGRGHGGDDSPLQDLRCDGDRPAHTLGWPATESCGRFDRGPRDRLARESWRRGGSRGSSERGGRNGFCGPGSDWKTSAASGERALQQAIALRLVLRCVGIGHRTDGAWQRASLTNHVRSKRWRTRHSATTMIFRCFTPSECGELR